MKVIDHLDDGALRWLAASPSLFLGIGDGSNVAITLAGGAPGFVQADRKRMVLATAFSDDADLARVGHGFGALFLAPGIGETLRVNGRIAATNAESIELIVDECYIHCAKALIRSDFWQEELEGETPPNAASFLAKSRFMALATTDAEGRTDVSPKGDPEGRMIQSSQDSVWFADRPGNRRADSFRNILAQARIATAVLIPGSTQVVIVSGVAAILTDEAARAPFAVGDKVPKIVTRIDEPTIHLQESAALARAKLWPMVTPAAVDPSAILVAHIKANQTRGLQATLVRMALSMPGLMEKGLKSDYKNNLY